MPLTVLLLSTASSSVVPNSFGLLGSVVESINGIAYVLQSMLSINAITNKQHTFIAIIFSVFFRRSSNNFTWSIEFGPVNRVDHNFAIYWYNKNWTLFWEGIWIKCNWNDTVSKLLYCCMIFAQCVSTNDWCQSVGWTTLLYDVYRFADSLISKQLID